MIMNTFTNTDIIAAVFPSYVIFAKIPQICKGKKGITILEITFSTIAWNSCIPFFNTSELITAAPIPKVKAINKAVITPIIGGISTVNNGDRERAFASAALIISAASSKRSEEHTSELQSRQYLVCRLLLEKKKKKLTTHKSLSITL